MKIEISNLEDIRRAARQFIDTIGNHNVLAFYGKMGVGKTTFIKAICEELGVEDVITSPTFAIVNEYTLAQLPARKEGGLEQAAEKGIYHFDFYRIKKLEEVYDMGFEDYFYAGAVCLIEWPELIEEVLPDDAVRVTITESSDGSRTISY